MVKSLCMALVYCPGLTCIQEGWQYHSLVDFQLGVKLDSISLPDICTESSECHTSLCNSGSDLIINMHCSGESASQVGELVNSFQFLPIHSDVQFLPIHSEVHYMAFRALVGVQPLSFLC